MIHTTKVLVKSNSPLYSYFCDLGIKVTNLYNTSTFMIRQAMTGSKKSKEQRQPNEHKVFHKLRIARPLVNKSYKSSYNKKLKKAKRDNNDKEIQKLLAKGVNKFDIPNDKHWFLDYYDLQKVLQVLDDKDYTALPAQLAQRVVQSATDSWLSYFENLKSWKEDPNSRSKPKIPGYRSSGSISTVILNNQISKFITKNERVFLRFPYTNEKLDLTELMDVYNIADCHLCEVKVVPKQDCFEVQIAYNDGAVEIESSVLSSSRIAAIDFGVDNIAAISNNVGVTPIIIKGNVIKAYNQWYNKVIGQYKSKAMTQNGLYTTTRINHLWEDRERSMSNLLGLISNAIIQYLKDNDIDTLVCGTNSDWKQQTKIGKTNNQNFVQIPHAGLREMLKYKCSWYGIRFVSREESYTSKASFFDMDYIPTYGQDDEIGAKFSGKRVHRGLYVSADGRKLNCDINGASNILRKEFPKAYSSISDFKYLMNVDTWEVYYLNGKTKIGHLDKNTKKLIQQHKNKKCKAKAIH